MYFIVSSEVARGLTRDSYALVFGVNTFVALLLQSVLTFTIAGSAGFALNITQQVPCWCSKCFIAVHITKAGHIKNYIVISLGWFIFIC